MTYIAPLLVLVFLPSIWLLCWAWAKYSSNPPFAFLVLIDAGIIGIVLLSVMIPEYRGGVEIAGVATLFLGIPFVAFLCKQY